MTNMSNSPDLNWSMPSKARDGTTDGPVYVGNEKATEEDLAALNADFGNAEHTGEDVDSLSVVGFYDRHWTSNFYSKNTGGDKPGGLGSHNYETQKWGGNGCQFKDYPVWHYTTEGDFVKEVPANLGECYKMDMGGGYYDLYAGVEPDSDCDKYLDGGVLVWDEMNDYYVRQGG
jgi:hypothetical protein